MNRVCEILGIEKPVGVIYASFKYGTFEGEQNGRFFTDFTEESFTEFLQQFFQLFIGDQWISNDVRLGRIDEKWLNTFPEKGDNYSSRS